MYKIFVLSIVVINSCGFKWKSLSATKLYANENGRTYILKVNGLCKNLAKIHENSFKEKIKGMECDGKFFCIIFCKIAEDNVFFLLRQKVRIYY